MVRKPVRAVSDKHATTCLEGHGLLRRGCASGPRGHAGRHRFGDGVGVIGKRP